MNGQADIGKLPTAKQQREFGYQGTSAAVMHAQSVTDHRADSDFEQLDCLAGQRPEPAIAFDPVTEMTGRVSPRELFRGRVNEMMPVSLARVAADVAE